MNVKLDYLHISLTFSLLIFVHQLASNCKSPARNSSSEQELSCTLFLPHLFLWVQSKKCHFEKSFLKVQSYLNL